MKQVLAADTIVSHPEVTTTVRLPGQSNSEFLFSWLVTKGHLWMLKTDRFEEIVGVNACLKTSYMRIKWERGRSREGRHEGPPGEAERENYFSHLERLVKGGYFEQVEPTP